jgi:hypothetical protein
MKAEELMIGDLVYYSYANLFVTKVIDVCSHGEEHFIRCKRDEKDKDNLYKQDQLEDFHVGIIRPIPLTKEILEKNGFEKNRDYGYFIGQSNSGYYIYFDNNHLSIQAGYDVIEFACCEYVHELQHVLNLCKIEKEIII